MKFASIAAAALLAVYGTPAWGEEGAETVPASDTAGATTTSSEPSTFESWWNGEESIYDTGFNLSFGFVTGGYNGGTLVTTGLDKSRKSTEILEGGYAGFRGDIGTSWRHFGLLILGAAYYTTGDSAMLKFDDGTAAPVSVSGLDLRLLQPRFRYAKWRFELAASAGPVVHLGWAKIDDTRLDGLPQELKSALGGMTESSGYGSIAAELGLGLRFYPLNFLFVEGAYNHSFAVVNILDSEMDGMNNLRFVAGLTF